MSGKRAALALITQGDKILCVWNRRYNGWGLPGGKCEDDEPLHSALCREAMEELGIEINHAVEIYEAPTVSSDSGRLVHVFRVTLYTGEPHQVEADSPVKWCTREELLGTSPFAQFYVKMFEAIDG